jgi:DNA repair exonuclease SbcCD ATPase subunit
MHKSRAGQIIDYRRDGRPIYMPAGGAENDGTSVPNVTTTSTSTNQPAQNGITLPVPPAPTAPPQQIDINAMRAEWEREAQQRWEAQRTELEQGFSARIAPFEQRVQEEAQRAAEAQRQAEEAARLAREAEESAAQRAERISQENAQRLAEIQQQLAERDALLAREREFNELQEYRRQQLAEHAETIHPTLTRFVQGYSREDIDRSVREAEEASMSLLADFATATGQQQAAAAAAQRAMPGVSATAPAAGPMEMASGTRTYSPEELKNMPMDQYAAIRSQIFGGGQQQRDMGIFS